MKIFAKLRKRIEISRSFRKIVAEKPDFVEKFIKIAEKPAFVEKFIKIAENMISSPEILDSMSELAEKTAKDAILQKIFDETQTKDFTMALFRKLVDTAREGVVVNVKMNNADVTLRKEDVFDNMARVRFNQMLREGMLTESPISVPVELR